MEQHPVPQNVTTFQFRLIGDMTIKQFGYLAGGAILAYISYILPLPFFFTWPLTVLFGLLGIGFAFVPIEERPMDVWVLSFLKSVYTPTQFVWHRTQPKPEPVTKPLTQPIVAPAKTPASPAPSVVTTPPTAQQPVQPSAMPIATTLQGFYTPTPAVHKKSFLDSLFSWVDDLFPKPKMATAPISFSQPAPVKPIVPAIAPQTQPSPATVPQERNPELDVLQDKISSLQTELGGKAQAETRVLELQKEMAEMAKQKREMEERLITMKKQATMPQTPQRPAQPAGVINEPKNQGPTVKIIMPDAAARAGLPRLTTFTNVVTGIIKDNQGGLLPGVLVTVRDKEGIPLRALKTNKIGQFAASTQLPNGVYFVEVEDPRGRYTFDRAQVTLNGTIVPAIEIGAKSKRDIDRETLAKQIFGQTTNT